MDCALTPYSNGLCTDERSVTRVICSLTTCLRARVTGDGTGVFSECDTHDNYLMSGNSDLFDLVCTAV